MKITPKILDINGIRIPYFFGLSAKCIFEEKFQKKAAETLRESLELHYINYCEGCRLLKEDPKLSFPEFVDVLDLNMAISTEILSSTLTEFSTPKKE